MGDVYLAQDTRLDRTVALKTLKPEIASEVERMRRFIQEAKMASSLNHPNILTIFEIGEVDSSRFIATEYIDGETLRQRLSRSSLDLNELLEIAVQVASALVAAHKAKIIHRDIKPENIMLRHDDRFVKVLDFGLAKLAEKPADTLPATEAPTLVNTAPGVVLGTVAYMSPEQARGVEVDERTDLWSLGVVLFEMVAGCLPFIGSSTNECIAAILSKEPAAPLARYAHNVPEKLEDIVAKALAKNREERYQSATDLLLDLKRLKQRLEMAAEFERTGGPTLSREEKPTVTMSAQPTSSAEYIAGQIKQHKKAVIALSASVMIALAALAFWLYKIGVPVSPASTAVLQPRPFANNAGYQEQPAFSPDGNQIAFAYRDEKEEHSNLYVKLIDSVTQLQLTHYQDADASWPTWSPDGRRIAFIRSNKDTREITIISSLGGAERKLYAGKFFNFRRDEYGSYAFGNLSWSPDGKFIAFSEKESEQDPFSIFLISVESGEKRKLTTPPVSTNEWGDMYPSFSPDGQTLAFARAPEVGVNDIYLVPSQGGQPTRLTNDNAQINGLDWTADGNEIVYSSWRSGTGNSTLWRVKSSGGAPQPLPMSGGGQGLVLPTVSRKGNRVAYQSEITNQDIWRIDLAQTHRPLTPGKFITSATEWDFGPQYSPDGKKVAFTSTRSGSHEVWICNSDGSNAVQLTDFRKHLTGTPRWSPDGRYVAFDSRPEGSSDIYVIEAEGGSPRRVTSGESQEVMPSWSRDGRWIYFTSNRSGSFEIWKVAAQGGEPVQVTKNNAFYAFESPDGKSLFYSKSVTVGGVWRMPVEGGPEEMVIDMPPPFYWGHWAVVETGIYFADPLSKPRATVKFFDFATKQRVPVAELQTVFTAAIPSFAVSPDRKSLLFVMDDRLINSIMLVENFR